MSETEFARASHCGKREREPTKEPERIYEASIGKVDFFSPHSVCCKEVCSLVLGLLEFTIPGSSSIWDMTREQATEGQ